MKWSAHLALVLLGAVCVGLAAAVVLMNESNRRSQMRLEARQQALNRGILGPQGQEIGRNLLTDLAGASAESPEIRALLQRHGYRVSAAAGGGAVTNAPGAAVPTDGKSRTAAAPGAEGAGPNPE